MEEVWNWYLSKDTSVQIGIWVATIATITFLINFIFKPFYRKFSNSNTIHKNEVIDKLRGFIDQAEIIDKKVQENKIGIDKAESEFVQWKIEVIRYLERCVGIASAERFLNLRTSLGSGIDLRHYKSSYQNHLEYIESIIAKLKENPKKKLEKNEHQLSLGKVKFIYR